MTKTTDLKTRFNQEIVLRIKESLGLKNDMAVPKILKVKVTIGIGSYIHAHGKDYSSLEENLKKITGQKPVVTFSKKAISNFKLKEHSPVGLVVTLRKTRMYDFLDKLINIVFPRVRDFRGISRKSFDGQGNYSIGFKEHTVFPEISPDDVIKLHGIQITIVTSAKDNNQGYILLKELGFPLKSEEKIKVKKN